MSLIPSLLNACFLDTVGHTIKLVHQNFIIKDDGFFLSPRADAVCGILTYILINAMVIVGLVLLKYFLAFLIGGLVEEIAFALR